MVLGGAGSSNIPKIFPICYNLSPLAIINSMGFILTELFVLLIIIGLFLVLSAVWPPDSPWAPWWQMPEDVIKKMCQMVKLSAKDVIYDLGCGTGKALCFAAKEYGAKGIGIEIDPIRVWVASRNATKINRVWEIGYGKEKKPSLPVASNGARSNLVTILKKNFFDIDISEASVIFVYLVPKALGKLLPKFLKELQPGTKIISYIYDFPNLKAKQKLQLVMYDKDKKIFLYKVK